MSVVYLYICGMYSIDDPCNEVLLNVHTHPHTDSTDPHPPHGSSRQGSLQSDFETKDLEQGQVSSQCCPEWTEMEEILTKAVSGIQPNAFELDCHHSLE